MAGTDAAGSQTLSRGIRVLEALAESDAPMTPSDLIATLGLHRSIVYRLLHTLEGHRLITRDDRGRIALGHGLAALALGVERDLRDASVPILRRTADALASTCFLVGYDSGEITTLISAAPHRSVVAVAQNPGTVHPVGVGAPGRAILSQLPPTEWPAHLPETQRRATGDVVTSGFAISHDEVVPGLHAVAVPLPLVGHGPLAVGVVCLAILDAPEQIAARLREAAVQITAAMAD